MLIKFLPSCSNSQRPGAIANMTMQEANRPRERLVKGKKYWLIQVDDHKTAASFGPATLVLDEKVTGWFISFRDFVRQARGSVNDVDPFFITTTGMKVTHLSNDLKEIAKAAGETLYMSATAVRKGVATRVAHSTPEVEKRYVHAHMGHSSKTAEEYYTSFTSAETHIEAVEQIQKAVTKRTTREESPKGKTPKRRKFTDCEVEAIENYFKGTKGSLEDCRQFLLEHPTIDRTPKNVQDKLKTMYQ